MALDLAQPDNRPGSCGAIVAPSLVPGSSDYHDRGQLVAIENAGDQFIIGDRDKLSNGGDDILRCAVALPTSTSGQAQLRVDPTHPVEEQDDLAGLGVDVGDH